MTGVVEVCKQIVAGSGLTGTFQFTVTGGNGFSSTVSVPVGDCSSPITVPAGLVMVRETGDLSESVTAITATQTAAGTNAIVGPNAGPSADLPTATVVAAVAAGDASQQTLVTVTNNSVRLKLCKYVDGGLTNTTAPGNSRFPFTFSAAGNAGPTADCAADAGGGELVRDRGLHRRRHLPCRAHGPDHGGDHGGHEGRFDHDQPDGQHRRHADGRPRFAEPAEPDDLGRARCR